jgi:hypothetical protein
MRVFYNSAALGQSQENGNYIQSLFNNFTRSHLQPPSSVPYPGIERVARSPSATVGNRFRRPT